MSRAVTTVVPGIFLRRPGLPIFGWIQAPLRPTACADAVTTTATAFVLRRRLDCCGALDARSIAIDTDDGQGSSTSNRFHLEFRFRYLFRCRFHFVFVFISSSMSTSISIWMSISFFMAEIVFDLDPGFVFDSGGVDSTCRATTGTSTRTTAVSIILPMYLLTK